MFKWLRMGLMALSLLWLASAYAQGSRDYVEFRDRLEKLQLSDERQTAKVEDLDRRVVQIETGARADRIDVRIARIEANLDSARAMLWGLGAPVALMAMEAILRLVTAARRGGKA